MLHHLLPWLHPGIGRPEEEGVKVPRNAAGRGQMVQMAQQALAMLANFFPTLLVSPQRHPPHCLWGCLCGWAETDARKNVHHGLRAGLAGQY